MIACTLWRTAETAASEQQKHAQNLEAGSDRSRHGDREERKRDQRDPEQTKSDDDWCHRCPILLPGIILPAYNASS
jgi:hypothetical protein